MEEKGQEGQGGHYPLKPLNGKNGTKRCTVPNGNGSETCEREGVKEPWYTPCLASGHPLPPSPSLLTRAHHALLCPPHGAPALLVSYSLALATVWAVAYCVLGRVALPGTQDIQVRPFLLYQFGLLRSLLSTLTRLDKRTKRKTAWIVTFPERKFVHQS